MNNVQVDTKCNKRWAHQLSRGIEETWGQVFPHFDGLNLNCQPVVLSRGVGKQTPPVVNSRVTHIRGRGNYMAPEGQSRKARSFILTSSLSSVPKYEYSPLHAHILAHICKESQRIITFFVYFREGVVSHKKVTRPYQKWNIKIHDDLEWTTIIQRTAI